MGAESRDPGPVAGKHVCPITNDDGNACAYWHLPFYGKVYTNCVSLRSCVTVPGFCVEYRDVRRALSRSNLVRGVLVNSIRGLSPLSHLYCGALLIIKADNY